MNLTDRQIDRLVNIKEQSNHNKDSTSLCTYIHSVFYQGLGPHKGLLFMYWNGPDSVAVCFNHSVKSQLRQQGTRYYGRDHTTMHAYTHADTHNELASSVCLFWLNVFRFSLGEYKAWQSIQDVSPPSLLPYWCPSHCTGCIKISLGKMPADSTIWNLNKAQLF